MSDTNNIVDEIVARVLAELTAAHHGDSTPTIFDNVVTAGTLSAQLGNARAVVFGPKTVLTPTAREFIRQNEIQWSRGDRTITTQTNATRCHALIVNSTSAVKRAIADTSSVDSSQANSVTDAAQQAVSMICRSDCDAVVVFSDVAETIACLANRNRKVRGVVVSSANDAKSQQKLLGSNVLAVKPSLLSYVEVRNVLRAVAGGGVPVAPDGWPE